MAAKKRKKTTRPEALSGPDVTFRLMDEAQAQPSDVTWRRGSLYVRTKYSLEELVSQINPTNRHAETDWGPPQGNET
jgi:antitoxin component of MazEF toxin-antitoxin module